MATNIITSQPAVANHAPSAVSDLPPTYEEVISQQPKPSNFNFAVNDNEVTSSLENGHSDAQLNSEQEDKCENCEEQQRRNITNRQRDSDCCFVCYVDNDPGWWICCKLFSDCCICIADCTETCCENCANCLQTCCESSGSEANEDCCLCDCNCDSSD